MTAPYRIAAEKPPVPKLPFWDRYAEALVGVLIFFFAALLVTVFWLKESRDPCAEHVQGRVETVDVEGRRVSVVDDVCLRLKKGRRP